MSHQNSSVVAVRKQAFSTIYDRHEWRGGSKSGPGSDPERTVEYRSLLQRFLKEHNIRSILDIGCGDWSFSRLIDWSGMKYIGIDTVESVIADNQIRFGSTNVSFHCMDAIQDALPQADLMLVKEVLQHLPINDVKAILNKVRNFRFAILVNDIAFQRRGSWRDLWRWQPVCSVNSEIRPGEYRLLALREPPFSVEAIPMQTYENRYENYRWIKEVLLIHGRPFSAEQAVDQTRKYNSPSSR